MKELTDGQRVSLDTFLTSYPNDEDFVTILELVERDGGDVVVCSLFSDIDNNSLIDLIHNLSVDIDNVMDEEKCSQTI